MTWDVHQERMDRVADLLAAAMESTLVAFASMVQARSLSEPEAVAVLTAMLQTQRIRLNDELLHTLVTALRQVDIQRRAD
jgi:hypothetical protein